MTNDVRPHAPTYISARLVCDGQEWRVLVSRFSATGLSFYAPQSDSAPTWNNHMSASIDLDLPDGTTFTAQGKLVSWKPSDAPGVGRCLLVEMQISVENRASAPEGEGFNRRRTPRLEIRANQPRCVVTHPLFTNTRMEFHVCDVSTSGLRLATIGQVFALFPQFVFSGEIVFPDNSQVPVKFRVRHVHFDSMSGTHIVGAQFVDNSIMMLSALSRKLLTSCKVDSEALRQSRLHYVFPSRQSRGGITQSQFEVRVVENLDEWQRVLHFRLAAMRAAGQLKEKSDIRAVMSPRDTLSTHLVACTIDGQIVATATVLQVARLGLEQRNLLPYGHHTDPTFDAFWDFSQYFLSPLYAPHEALDALVGFALSHAAQAECPCLVVSVTPEWSHIFDTMKLAPSVIERSEGPSGNLSVYYFLAGDAQERYLKAPGEPALNEDAGALSQFFRKIIRNKDAT